MRDVDIVQVAKPMGCSLQLWTLVSVLTSVRLCWGMKGSGNVNALENTASSAAFWVLLSIECSDQGTSRDRGFAYSGSQLGVRWQLVPPAAFTISVERNKCMLVLSSLHRLRSSGSQPGNCAATIGGSSHLRSHSHPSRPLLSTPVQKTINYWGKIDNFYVCG